MSHPNEPWQRALAGTLHEHWIESDLLRDNWLGDPYRRPLWVYTPPGYDDGADDYPAIYVIQGMTGQLDMWRNRTPFRPTFPELLDRDFDMGTIRPCLVCFVDCWTSLGGSQFLDSPATGRYHSYLCEEVVSFVDARYRTKPAAAHRAITGKSSGGYGAMVTPMLRPDLFGALATHAGDALFEQCYGRDFGPAVRALRDEYGGSWAAVLQDFRDRPALTKPTDALLLNMYAMAACYSADPDGTVRFPFDLETAELVPEIWDWWLHWDPVRMAQNERYAEALKGLRAVYVDAGKHDEYYLDVGAEAFVKALRKLGL
ncbi:MAG: alpha/beta hydrolase, partial [Solirubrobacteraceae bacterium]